MEEWKNDILASLDGIQRAEPPGDLFARIQDSIRTAQIVKKVRWQLVAASITVILGCNLYAVKQYISTKPGQQEIIEAPYSSNFNIYEL